MAIKNHAREFLVKNYWILILIVFLFGPPLAYAAIPHDVAVRIIVGEAGDQGLKGMTCVGEVLRRRGSIKGFYGYHSKRIKKQPKSVWKNAEKAWKQSAYTNYTNGANHFANVRQFRRPSWIKYCVKTYEYKDHVFYRELHRRKR